MTLEEEMLAAMEPAHTEYVEMLRRMYTGIDDWDYHCLPWITPKYFDDLIKLVGIDNIKIAVCSAIEDVEHGKMLHPTVFISPAGKANLKKYNAG